MKIYGQADDIIVREMTEDDMEQFYRFMKENNVDEGFSVKEIGIVYRRRKLKGDLQCCITSKDGNTVYGFCGIYSAPSNTKAMRIDFFKKYRKESYRQQAKEILMRMTLNNLFGSK